MQSLCGSKWVQALTLIGMPCALLRRWNIPHEEGCFLLPKAWLELKPLWTRHAAAGVSSNVASSPTYVPSSRQLPVSRTLQACVVYVPVRGPGTVRSRSVQQVPAMSSREGRTLGNLSSRLHSCMFLLCPLVVEPCSTDGLSASSSSKWPCKNTGCCKETYRGHRWDSGSCSQILAGRAWLWAPQWISNLVMAAQCQSLYPFRASVSLKHVTVLISREYTQNCLSMSLQASRGCRRVNAASRNAACVRKPASIKRGSKASETRFRRCIRGILPSCADQAN